MQADVSEASGPRHQPVYAVGMSDSIEKSLKGTIEDRRLRRAFAARLDMTMKRAKLTSAQLAKALRVPERDISLWRAGVLVPESMDCVRLSRLLGIDVMWLCAGDAMLGEPAL